VATARARGESRARQYVDVMLGNEEDFTASLGFEVENVGESFDNLQVDSFQEMIELAIGCTELLGRGDHAAQRRDGEHQRLGPLCYADGKLYPRAHARGPGHLRPHRGRRLVRVGADLRPLERQGSAVVDRVARPMARWR